MKSTFVGWMSIIISIFNYLFLLSNISIVVQIPSQINKVEVLGFNNLFAGIFFLVWGISVKKHKPWSWYCGIFWVPLALTAIILEIIKDANPINIIALILLLFSLYAFFSDKRQFFENQRNKLPNTKIQPLLLFAPSVFFLGFTILGVYIEVKTAPAIENPIAFIENSQFSGNKHELVRHQRCNYLKDTLCLFGGMEISPYFPYTYLLHEGIYKNGYEIAKDELWGVFWIRQGSDEYGPYRY